MFDQGVVANNFDKAAADYDEHALLQKQVRRLCVDQLHAHLAPRSHILDLGCGTGALLDETRQAYDITGLDLASGMCHAASARGMRVSQAQCEALPCAMGTFDGIFSSLMLQWANRPSLVLAEIQRVLRPQGYAIIGTLCEGTLAELHSTFAAVDDGAHVSRFYAPHDVLHCAKEVGLTMVSAHQHCFTDYFPDVVALMRSLKVIGANNGNQARSRGMMTPKKLAQLEAVYTEKFATAKGLPASWQVLIMVLQRT